MFAPDAIGLGIAVVDVVLRLERMPRWDDPGMVGGFALAGVAADRKLKLAQLQLWDVPVGQRLKQSTAVGCTFRWIVNQSHEKMKCMIPSLLDIITSQS